MKRPVCSSAPAFAATALVTVFIGACSSSRGAAGPGDGGTPHDSGGDTGAVVVDASIGDDAGGGGDTSDDAALPAAAGVRFAVWAASPFPAVDFCVAPHGTTAFVGPMLHRATAAADGGDDDAGAVRGLTFPLVTSYFSFPPGQYDARVVAAGSADCRVGVFPDATDLPTLGAAGTETVALLDQLAPEAGSFGVQITGFADDATAGIQGSVNDAGLPTSGRPLIRFINATSAEPLVDLGFGLDSIPPNYTPIFLGVPFGQHSTLSETTVMPADTDDQGYLSFAPLTGNFVAAVGTTPAMVIGNVFGARRTRTDTMLATATFFGAPGAVISMVLLPSAPGSSDEGSDGGTTEAILLCFDNAGSAGALSDCFFSR